MTDDRIAVAISTADSLETEAAVELDPRIFDFLLSPVYAASVQALKRQHELSDDDTVFITDLERLVMAGQLDLEGFLAVLEDELGSRLPDVKRDALYSALLAEHFLPLGDFLKPSAQEVARTEELALPSAPHYQVYFKPLTYSGVATEVAATAGFFLMGGPIRERLRELIISKIKGVRVDSQAMEAMQRAIDFGGLGLDRAMAEKTLKAMNDILRRAQVMSEDEYAAWLSDEALKKSAPASAAPAVSHDPEDEEIARIQARMPQPVVDASSELAKAVETTLQRIPNKPADEYLLKRLRNVISSRLRDVRSALEVKQLLMRDVKVGGLGQDTANADTLAKQIEAAYQEFHVSIADEEKRKIEMQLEEQKRKVEERRRKEAEEHAKWYEEKIRTRKAGEEERSKALEAMRQLGKTTPIHPVDLKEKKAETAKFGPMVPANLNVCPIGAASAAKTEVRVSQATAELSQAARGAKPKVDGVAYAAPQLVGLVGELSLMSVAEFRRLSKNPQDAVRKITEKIETLGQESFEKRIEGVQALRNSPLQTAYLSLVGEGFRSGKPMTALAEEKRKAGQDTLSSDEIGAIVQLNSALHF